jgi:hypothetical protein
MASRLALPVVFLVALVIGCRAEPPAAGPPAPGEGGATGDSSAPDGRGGEGGTEAVTPGDAPTVEAATACSASHVAGDLRVQSELPPAVAATRRAIFAAATSCDLDALGELAPADLSYSFGGSGDAVGSWREAEGRGEPVLRWMTEVLRATPAEQDGLWVWPGFFLRPVAEWTAEERREAERLLGEDLELATGSGAYLGYRLGIAADGTWRYFVAGD